MGGGAADERQARVLPRVGVEPILQHGRHELASLPIPDELMAEILLRLPTPADLVRASAACASFRRVAADRSFLRRFRKLHAPPFLGFLDRLKAFNPAVAPHPSASAANAVASAADFSFSFLPAPTRNWILRDSRDGRVLLDRPHKHDIKNFHSVVFPELVVCDPLHRRYILLPPIPENLTTTVEDPLWISEHRYCETFLAPSRHKDDETSFSVIWMAQCETKLAAFVFSSSTAQWRAISSQSWSDLLDGLLSRTGLPLFSFRQYAYGCFYWVTDWGELLLVLDTRRMEFSVAEPPPEAGDLALPGVAIAIVEAGEGMLGMFVRPHYKNYVNYTIRRNSCGSSGQGQWQMEKTISLDSGYLFMGSAGRHLFLYQCGSPSLDAGYFLLDVKTFQLEQVSVSNSGVPIISGYSNFPPSLLSTPTVLSGKLYAAF
jgi:hypothetical protein